MDFWKFDKGLEFEAYNFLGAHITEDGVVFRTYAPRAVAVSVMGEFSNWQEIPMKRIHDGRFWEGLAEHAVHGQMYKFRICQKDGRCVDHADPYAFFSELRPNTASVIYDMDRYTFRDEEWTKQRTDNIDRPLNIYEVHLGSWKRKGESEREDPTLIRTSDAPDAQVIIKELPEDVSGGWYRYEEIAPLLIPYLKENGYNAVEIMPLNEYPADESWGYQATGFFSATARYGEPSGLMELVDSCHQNGISVILDVVTVHFARNDYSLMNFDGLPLYEYPHPAVGYSEWGSCNFNHAIGEVRTFLQSACAFWLERYHFDGLRFDAVGNLIYWQGNQARGVNKDAVRFLQTMNAGLKERFPHAMLIAEDSTAYPKVTRPVWENGLGFDYKWDLGWMNDTLAYFKEWPVSRDRVYHKLTFSMQYFYNENYVLPLSHDEVVHGKATIAQKMYGLYDGKFSQARAMYLYMYLHPGKKLSFMGNEIAQLREWDEKKQQDWFLQKYPLHDSFHHFIIDLNHLYLLHSSLWEYDYDRRGFEWLEADRVRENIYVFRRRSEEESILCMFNFSGEERDYDFRPGWSGQWTLLLDSDEEKYSGTTRAGTEKEFSLGETERRILHLPPFTGRCYLEKGI